MRRRVFLKLAFLLALTTGGLPLSAQAPLVYRLTVSGVVENGLAPYLIRGLRGDSTSSSGGS